MKISMQFFSEKDIKNQESASLMRAIRKYRKRIAEHERYIRVPWEHCPEWETYSDKKKSGLIRHWTKEIENFHESIADRIDELIKRGDYHE